MMQHLLCLVTIQAASVLAVSMLTAASQAERHFFCCLTAQSGLQKDLRDTHSYISELPEPNEQFDGSIVIDAFESEPVDYDSTDDDPFDQDEVIIEEEELP